MALFFLVVVGGTDDDAVGAAEHCERFEPDSGLGQMEGKSPSIYRGRRQRIRDGSGCD